MKISITYSRTQNLGNFNSVRAEAGVEVDLDDSEALEVEFERNWKIVRAQVQERLNEEKT